MTVGKTRDNTIPPSVSPDVGIRLLDRLVSDADKLLSQGRVSDLEKRLWETTAKEYLTRAFGSVSPHIQTVLNFGHRSFDIDGDDEYFGKLRFQELKDMCQAVLSVRKFLELDIELTKSCLRCGTRQTLDNNFCVFCGASLQGFSEQTTEKFPDEDPTLAFKTARFDVGAAKPTFRRIDGKYFDVNTDGEPLGDPYCSRCWEVDKRKVHLGTWEGMTICNQCSTTYD